MKYILFVSILIYASSEQYEAHLIKDFTQEVISEILSILAEGIVHVVANCTVDPETPQVTYWLSTRQNEDYVEIQNLSSIDFEKPVMVVAHGWKRNRSSDGIIQIRDAYLKRYDANLIVMDYAHYANERYVAAYCVLPKVAINLAKFLCDLNRFYNISNLHIAGHSIGAQLAGQAGYLTQKNCNARIGRITGMDPAGPLYQFINIKSRLDKSDALFVDVIHTNQGQYGYTGNVGHVDFYPNCGTFQPGCFSTALNSSLNMESILQLPLAYIICNHERSAYYFAESLNNNSFYSTNCFNNYCDGLLCFTSIVHTDHTYMGESCRSPQRSPAYTLKTASKPPFALGPEAPLS